MQSKTVYYEIRIGQSTGHIDHKGNHNYDNLQDAINEVKSFKAMPHKHTPHMSAENISYWQNQIYKIVKVTKEVEEIEY